MNSNAKRLASPAERATALLAEHNRIRSWAKLEQKYGVPGGTLSRFANSGGAYVPRMYADALGFELPIMKPAPACPQCGQVHVRSKCTQRKPLPEWVTRAADFLREREQEQSRVYGRGGRKVASS